MCSVLLLSLALMHPAIAKEKAEAVSLNFVNADIDAVLRAVSKITNKNFVVDPRVKGTMNIVTSKPVSPAEAYQIFLSALRLQGFTAIDENGIVKVVPEADAKMHSIPVNNARSGLRGDQPITQIFNIKNESATQLLQVIRPLVTANNTVTAYQNNNTLVVTDYAENIERIARIIDAIDVPQGDVVAIPVKYASALDISNTIGRLMDSSNSGAASDASQRVTVIPDVRINTLLVRSENPSRLSAIKQLVATLDQPGVAGNIHVIYLKNAEAPKVARTLRAVLAGDSGLPLGNEGQATASTSSSSSMGGSTPSLSRSADSSTTPQSGGIVVADVMNNALIITAPDAIYNNLRRVVDMLDRRRAQVMVEALIAEITADKAAEFGFQWQSAKLPATGDKKAVLFGGTNFGSAATGNILSVAADPSAVNNGLNLIVGKGTLTFGGQTILSLTALAHFLESQANTNILSTPNLLMVDNEEAKIVVGQNLPFVTGQYTNTGSGSTVANPFQTIERHDVGLTLKIKSQISEGGTVLLQIAQESSSVVASTLNNTSGPVTNKRSIDTVALVDDGAIIALGGLVQDSDTSGVDQVPWLGDLPVVGNLFKSKTRQRTKTNLFVFLRPKILRDSDSYQNIADDRYDYVIGQQRKLNQTNNLMRNEATPELPPKMARPQPLPGNTDSSPISAPSPAGTQ